MAELNTKIKINDKFQQYRPHHAESHNKNEVCTY